MTQKCRLTERAQMAGEVRERGYVFELPDGGLGPHRSKITSHETLDVANDSRRVLPDYEDEPLYEVWDGKNWVRPETSDRAG